MIIDNNDNSEKLKENDMEDGSYTLFLLPPCLWRWVKRNIPRKAFDLNRHTGCFKGMDMPEKLVNIAKYQENDVLVWDSQLYIYGK